MSYRVSNASLVEDMKGRFDGHHVNRNQTYIFDGSDETFSPGWANIYCSL